MNFIMPWLCAVSAILFLAAVVLSILGQLELSHPEGLMAWAVWEMASGGQLYVDPYTWPYRFNPYGPLLYYPIGAIARILNADYGFWTYLAGRIQSLLYIIATSCIASDLIRRLTGFRASATYAYVALQIILWPTLFIGLASYRPDIAVTFWTLAALSLATRQPFNPKYLFLSTVPIVIANLYKPSSWALPVAVVLWQLAQFRWRYAITWSALLGAQLLVSFGLLQACTSGLWFINLSGTFEMGTSTGTYQLLWHSLVHWDDYPGITIDTWLRIIVGTLTGLSLLYEFRARRSSPFCLVGGYCLIAVAVGHAGLFKLGSAFNYLLEGYLASAIVVAVFWKTTHENPNAHSGRRKFIYASAVLLFVIPLPMHTWLSARTAAKAWTALSSPSPYQPLMELSPKPLLSDLSWLHPNPEAHALLDPSFYFSALNNGRVSPDLLIGKIAKREYSHIALGLLWQHISGSPQVMRVKNALAYHYKREVINPYYDIWVPRNAGPH